MFCYIRLRACYVCYMFSNSFCNWVIISNFLMCLRRYRELWFNIYDNNLEYIYCRNQLNSLWLLEDYIIHMWYNSSWCPWINYAMHISPLQEVIGYIIDIQLFYKVLQCIMLRMFNICNKIDLFTTDFVRSIGQYFIQT